MTSEKLAITNSFAHVDYFPGNMNTIYVRTNTKDKMDCKRKKYSYI